MQVGELLQKQIVSAERVRRRLKPTPQLTEAIQETQDEVQLYCTVQYVVSYDVMYIVRDSVTSVYA